MGMLMMDEIRTKRFEDSKPVDYERLAYVDFKLFFTGTIKRSDMKDMFDLGDAAASKVFSQYKGFRPDNMDYTRQQHTNTFNREKFKPLIEFGAELALGMLANGFNKNKLTDRPMQPYARVGKVPNQLNANEVAKITRAISGCYGIKCNYISKNSDNHGERVLLPFALVFDGKTWMFRAYDRSHTGNDSPFKHFHFSRSKNIVELEKEFPKEHEKQSRDKEWNTQIPLLLRLHENIMDDQKKDIRYEFCMDENADELVLTERLSLYWILSRQWFIDDGKRDENLFYKFKLINRDVLSI